MKKIIQLQALVFAVFFLSSCDKDFDQINTSQTAALSIDPAFILNRAILGSANTTGSIVYEMG
ncbi:MAG: hypothetical protein ACRC2O_16250, partial [Chitinophagaceae bacterium]